MKSGLAESLGSLCANIEAMTPGAIAGLTICNEGQTHIETLSSPSLPIFVRGRDHSCTARARRLGSCVKAISKGEVITCSDIKTTTVSTRVGGRSASNTGCEPFNPAPIALNGKPCGTCSGLKTEIRIWV